MKKFIVLVLSVIMVGSCTDDIWDSINALQGDVSTLQGEVSSIKGDIRVMTDNISEIQYDLEQGLSVVYVLDSIQTEMLEQQELDEKWLRDVSYNLDHLVVDVLPDTLYAYRILFANLIETSRNMLEAAQRNCEELRQLKDASDERYQEICDSISLGFVTLRQLTDKAGYYTFIKDMCWSLDQAVSELSEQYEYHEHWLKDVSDAIAALDKNSDRINSIASRISVIEEQLEEINKKVVFSRTTEFNRSMKYSTVTEYNKYGQIIYKRIDWVPYGSKREYFYNPGSSTYKEIYVAPQRQYCAYEYYPDIYSYQKSYSLLLDDTKPQNESWGYRSRSGFSIGYYIHFEGSKDGILNAFELSNTQGKTICARYTSTTRSLIKIEFTSCSNISVITIPSSQYVQLRNFIITLYGKYSSANKYIYWSDFVSDWNEFVNGAGKDLCLPTIS